MKIAILGDGAMGTACSVLLATKPENAIQIWSAFPEQAREMQQARENVRFLPGVKLPEHVQVTSDIEQASSGVELLVAAIPTVYLRKTLSRIGEHLPQGVPMVSIIKGMEDRTFLRPSQIIAELLSPRAVAVLSGPSHAEEISRHLPATVVAASSELEIATLAQQLFSTPRFRVYTNPDMVGVELAAALKNIIGLAAGVCDGLEFGDNAKSALLTRGLVEMTRFGVALGGRSETFSGLAGMGDLITTCISRHGRNRRVGEALGRGQKLEEILAAMQAVAEGVSTCRAVHGIAEQRGIEMPITTEMNRVLYEGKHPLEAVNDLMLRQPKAEY